MAYKIYYKATNGTVSSEYAIDSDNFITKDGSRYFTTVSSSKGTKAKSPATFGLSRTHYNAGSSWKTKVGGKTIYSGTKYTESEWAAVADSNKSIILNPIWTVDTHKVELYCDKGISKVTGGGNVEYGTKITIKATAATGYHFTSWSDGDTNKSRKIIVTGDITLTAQAAANTYTVKYYTADGTHMESADQIFNYNESGQLFNGEYIYGLDYTIKLYSFDPDVCVICEVGKVFDKWVPGDYSMNEVVKNLTSENNGIVKLTETNEPAVYRLPTNLSPPPAYPNLVFDGWTDGVNNYTDSITVNDSNDGIKLYGKWKNAEVPDIKDVIVTTPPKAHSIAFKANSNNTMSLLWYYQIKWNDSYVPETPVDLGSGRNVNCVIDKIQCDYAILDYIEFEQEGDNHAYIDTGIVPSDDCSIFLTWSTFHSGSNYIFGARASSDNKILTIGGSQTGGTVAATIMNNVVTANTDGTAWARQDNVENMYSTDIFIYDGRASVNFYDSSGNQSFNDIENVSLGTQTQHLYLFSNGYANVIGKNRIYSCKIYDHDVLVRDLVPAKNVDNEVGMLDIVSWEFLRNSGTGSFTPSTYYEHLTIPIYPSTDYSVKLYARSYPAGPATTKIFNTRTAGTSEISPDSGFTSDLKKFVLKLKIDDPTAFSYKLWFHAGTKTSVGTSVFQCSEEDIKNGKEFDLYNDYRSIYNNLLSNIVTTDGLNGNVVVDIDVYYSGATAGIASLASRRFTVSLTSLTPEVTNPSLITLTETNQKVSNILSDINGNAPTVFIQNRSGMRFSIGSGSITFKEGASLKSIEVLFDAIPEYGSSTTFGNINITPKNATDSTTAIVRITDTRNFKTDFAIRKISISPYSPPAIISVVPNRKYSDTENGLWLTIRGRYSIVNRQSYNTAELTSGTSINSYQISPYYEVGSNDTAINNYLKILNVKYKKGTRNYIQASELDSTKTYSTKPLVKNNFNPGSTVEFYTDINNGAIDTSITYADGYTVEIIMQDYLCGNNETYTQVITLPPLMPIFEKYSANDSQGNIKNRFGFNSNQESNGTFYFATNANDSAGFLVDDLDIRITDAQYDEMNDLLT